MRTLSDVRALPRHPPARMTPGPITTICFDAGDTLIAYRRPIRILLQDFFIERDEIVSRDAIAESLDAVDSRYRRLARQVRTVEEERRMWLELARDLLDLLLPRKRELYPALAKWFADSWKHFKVFRDAPPTLKKLRGSGYKLAVVSNWEPSLPVILNRLDLDSYFETIVTSSIEGVWKPDPQLYRIALGRLGALPTQALSVGDHVERDIKAAWDAGMQAILLDRFDDYPKFSPRVRNLSELHEWLELHARQRPQPIGSGGT